MFVEAIEKAAQFTRPIHTISRNYGSTIVVPAAATLFFVNADGWFLTARHVAQQVPISEALTQKCETFRKELVSIRGNKREKQLRKEIEQEYGFTRRTTYEMYNTFLNCVGFKKLFCTSFPVFPADTSRLKQGRFLCRLGFPFPEFSNLAYDATSERITWTDTGRVDTPRFPLEGMVTRHIANAAGQIVGFELSSPGLRGQSGAPVFDAEGMVWGIQVATGHLDLNFDVDQEVIRDGSKTRVKDSAFLHIGLCVHVDAVKQFMRNNNVAFREG